MPTYAHKFVKVTLSGKMMGGSEEWQTGFHCSPLTQDASAPTQAYADAVRDAWIPFFTAFGNGFSSAYTFEQVKLAMIGTNGKYDGTDPVISTPTTTVNGGSSGNPLPPQLALVATLVAGSGKGLAGKGRMYLPGIKFGVDGGGHITQSDCQGIANGLKTFFDTINASTSRPGPVANVSGGHAKLGGVGARNVPVNGVRVGNVYDTQRRRRSSLQETYSTAVVADS